MAQATLRVTILGHPFSARRPPRILVVGYDGFRLQRKWTPCVRIRSVLPRLILRLFVSYRHIRRISDLNIFRNPPEGENLLMINRSRARLAYKTAREYLSSLCCFEGSAIISKTFPDEHMESFRWESLYGRNSIGAGWGRSSLRVRNYKFMLL